MSLSNLHAITKQKADYNITDVISLQCASSSGAEETKKVKDSRLEHKVSYSEIANHLKASTKIYTVESLIDSLLKEEHLFVKPKTFTPIEGSSCFYSGVMHTIIAEAKEGKTTFVTSELSKIEKKVVLLDGDSNSTSMIEQADDNIRWLQPTEPDKLLDLFNILVDKSVDFSEYVFVIDSLQNFTGGKDLDSNNGMKEIVLRLKKITNTGGTLVVLHHVTATSDSKKPFKPKGNSEVLFSSSDVTYGFTRNDGLTAIKSRIEGIENGQQLGYGQNPHTLVNDDDNESVSVLDTLTQGK